ncbi:GntR family transcriptional regulator [Variovorax sp. HJSM1_2]|uniref:GntR family transcriptional regulator n=1 Tax=Variovorax sp. HJSM1_2 TaxID=3366263 RepID=UPI003BEBAEAE
MPTDISPSSTSLRRKPAAAKALSSNTKAAKGASSASALSTDQIYQRILTAVLEHRLVPGTQLVEDKLATIFEVSRTKVREATGRLVHDRIAINIPNRGAFVASPTPQEARDVFTARRLIEPSLVRTATEVATPKQIATLRAHVARENKARAAGDATALIVLTGEFHLMLAEIAGNGFLARTLRELESLTCLCIILYDAPGSPSCAPDEHEQLLAAVEARDADRAAALMLHHLAHIEAGLNLTPRVEAENSLEDAFR